MTPKDPPAKTGHLSAGYPFMRRMDDDVTRIADNIKRRTKGARIGEAEAEPLNWKQPPGFKAYST
jgi:hypothetical protein